MNARDNTPDVSPHDTELLTTIEHALQESRSLKRSDLDPLAGYCADVARTIPRADPAFQEMLGRRLAVEIERRSQRTGALARMGSWLRIPRPASRLRPISALLALLVVIGGTGGYLSWQGPTAVDAGTLLNRVAAASPGPNEAVHEVFALSAAGGATGQTEVWIAADANGAPVRIALTQSNRVSGSSTLAESGRLVQTPGLFQVYDPTTNTVTESSSDVAVRESGSASTPSVQDLENILVGTLVAQKLTRAVAVGMHPQDFKLAQQTLDGISVYALRLDLSASQTYYFNSQSYVLEGVDWNQGGRSWRARLDPGSYQTMALGSVPSGTFTLNAPSTARKVTLTPSPGQTKGNAQDQTISTLATACKSTASAVAAALQSGGRSLLAICQQTAPSMTADELVAALLVPYKSQLDTQVASGSITAAEEATDLANLRTKLTVMVTGEGGPGPKGAPPK